MQPLLNSFGKSKIRLQIAKCDVRKLLKCEIDSSIKLFVVICRTRTALALVLHIDFRIVLLVEANWG